MLSGIWRSVLCLYLDWTWTTSVRDIVAYVILVSETLKFGIWSLLPHFNRLICAYTQVITHANSLLAVKGTSPDIGDADRKQPTGGSDIRSITFRPITVAQAFGA
jgi:hypothetical protein